MARLGAAKLSAAAITGAHLEEAVAALRDERTATRVLDSILRANMVCGSI